jgi:segregation and condensation protein B
MSLKAKLEAVIYAAEEPVTLNQLAALFTADALEWKAAQQAAAAEQTAEVAGVSPDTTQTLPLIVQALESPASSEGSAEAPPDTETEAQPASADPAAAEPEVPGTSEVVSIGEAEAYPSIAVEAGPLPAAESAPAAVPALPAGPVDAESEAKRLARQTDRDVKEVLKHLLDELIADYQADARGVEIREIAGGYRMATKPECHDAVRLFVKSLKPPLKLSLPALETLAVIAYKQPVTAPEVNEIRGVESAGVLGSLLARKLIATAGRKPVIGRPILYKTTKEFLLRFGLKDVSELPSMEEFEKMAATELEMEPEVVEADRAAENAEAAAQEAEGAGQNEEATLDSNSPSGEELVGASEATDGGEVPAKPQPGPEAPEPSAESGTAASTESDEPAQAGSGREDTPPAQSGVEQEIEATSHAQESSQESEKG